jgi:hypothetical protein
MPYPERDLEVTRYEDDITLPTYGFPAEYELKTSTTTVTGKFKALKANQLVHASRVHLISDGLLEDNVHGTPRLEAIWNDLDNLEKVGGAGAEAFWRNAIKGLALDIDPEIQLSPEAETKLTEYTDDYIHDLRRVMMLRGTKVQELGSSPSDFAGPVGSIISLISGQTGIPQRILLGSERGELASTQDRDNWQEQVTDRRTDFAGPYVVRPLVDLFIRLGVLPEPISYDIRWPTLEPSEAEKAALAKLYAEVNKAQGGPVILANEIRDKAFGWEPLSDEDLQPLALPGQPEDIEQPEVEEEQPIAAIRSARPRRAKTALDKRRIWWRRVKERRKSQTNV